MSRSWFSSVFKRRGRKLSDRQLNRLFLDVERYERILKSNLGYGFLDWDISAHRMYWDGGFWRGLGYSDRDMTKLTDSDEFIDVVHPEDRERLKGSIDRHIKSRGPGQVNFRIRKKYGGYISVEVRVEAVRDAEGKLLYTSGLIFDITKLKQTEEALLISEARHARIIKASNDGIWEWTAEYDGFHFSNRCWEQLGFGSDDNVLNHGIDRLGLWRSRIHEEDLVLFDKALHVHFEDQSPFDVEYRVLGKDERWRWIRARGQMEYTGDGKPWKMSGTNIDITEIKRAETRVVEAREQAEKANKAKSEFLSSMSHELRTPLNAILGFAQLFDLDTNLDEEQKDNVNEIKKAGRHLLQLVGEVLDLAKIESGRMELVLEQVLINTLVRDCIALVRSQADARGVRIVFDSRGKDISLVSDERRLKQVILNLISNAVKYNKQGGCVDVSCHLLESARVKIVVKDTGRGLATNQIDKLFQPFNRLGAETSNIEGTGVGLVISKNLAEQMGGSISVSSELDVGSVFSLEVPLKSESYVDDLNAVENHRGASDDIPLYQVQASRRVLYIEDSKPNQRLMAQIVNRYPSIEFDVVGEGFRGLYEARTNQPDLIFLDINLPGMDGYETLAVLRRDEMTKHIPVVAVSANAMKNDVERGLHAGFERYLTKPIVVAEVVQVLIDYLDKEPS